MSKVEAAPSRSRALLVLSSHRHPDVLALWEALGGGRRANVVLCSLADGFLRLGYVDGYEMLPWKASEADGAEVTLPVRLTLNPRRAPDLYRFWHSLEDGRKAEACAQLLQQVAREVRAKTPRILALMAQGPGVVAQVGQILAPAAAPPPGPAAGAGAALPTLEEIVSAEEPLSSIEEGVPEDVASLTGFH